MNDPSTARSEAPWRPRPDVRAPARNRWFYNKLLDAYHMQLETDYFNHKRWLVNRFVLGSGVIAGLDVVPGKDAPRSVLITPGLAIDWHGREVIVPKEAGPYQIDQSIIDEAVRRQRPQPQKPQPQTPQHPKQQQQQQQQQQHGGGPAGQHVWIQVQLCYQETEGDPVPADPGGACDDSPCVPGTIYEGFSVRFAPTPARGVDCECRIPDLVEDGRIDHAALARWVTRHRPLEPPRNSCLALANVRIDLDGAGDAYCQHEHIDVTVRPVVYANDLLFQMFLCLNQGPGPQYPK